MGADRKSIHIKGTERFMESDAGWHPTEKRGNRNAFFLIRSLKMRNGRNNTDVLTRYHCFVKRGSFMLISISLMSLYPRFFLSNPSCCKAIFTWNDNIGIWPEYPPEHLLLEFSSMNSNSVCTQVFFFSLWKPSSSHVHATLYDSFLKAFASACAEQIGLGDGSKWVSLKWEFDREKYCQGR